MTEPTPASSGRRAELLDLAYRYVLDHGLTGLSLRPLAAAIGSSPRVLLYLFGSKDGLVRAVLDRARAEELALLERSPAAHRAVPRTLEEVARALWEWLAATEHRALLTLWLESYARSLVEPAGPWGGFARSTVDDWLAILAGAGGVHGEDARTLVLAVLRGALLDLLATGDTARTGAAVDAFLRSLPAG